MPEPEAQVPYDRRGLYEELAEVEGYLTELRYIDTAMAYMEEISFPFWTALGENTFYITVRYGTTFPFEKQYVVPKGHRLPWQESKTEEVEKELRALAAQAVPWAADNVASIVRWIEPFTWPVGSVYESECVRPVVDAYELLEDTAEVDTDLALLGNSIGDWEGAAADDFNTNFYLKFEGMVRSQKRLLVTLADGIATAQAIAQSTQHSLMNVVHYTRLALHEQLELCAATAALDRQETARTALIIAGAGATIVGGIFTSGMWAATGAALIAGGSSIAAVAIPDRASTNVDLRGTTAEQLFISMASAIAEIEKNDGRQHQDLNDMLEQVIGRVERLRGGGDGDDDRLIPQQPLLLDGVDARTFNLPGEGV